MLAAGRAGWVGQAAIHTEAHSLSCTQAMSRWLWYLLPVCVDPTWLSGWALDCGPEPQPTLWSPLPGPEPGLTAAVLSLRPDIRSQSLDKTRLHEPDHCSPLVCPLVHLNLVACTHFLCHSLGCSWLSYLYFSQGFMLTPLSRASAE